MQIEDIKRVLYAYNLQPTTTRPKHFPVLTRKLEEIRQEPSSPGTIAFGMAGLIECLQDEKDPDAFRGLLAEAKQLITW